MIYMSELDEITQGKTIEELKKELDFQVNTMGECMGGCICSHILGEIKTLENQLK